MFICSCPSVQWDPKTTLTTAIKNSSIESLMHVNLPIRFQQFRWFQCSWIRSSIRWEALKMEHFSVHFYQQEERRFKMYQSMDFYHFFPTPGIALWSRSLEERKEQKILSTRWKFQLISSTSCHVDKLFEHIHHDDE